MTRVKTKAEIVAMRESGRMLALVLEKLRQEVRVDISTQDLADIARAELKGLGGKPAFLGYHGFPDVLCTSVNDEIVHGIPNHHVVLASGDLIGMDFGVIYNGMITDAAISVIVGKPTTKAASDLLSTTEQSLYAAISVLRDSVRVGDIGAAAQAVLEHHKYGIVRDLVGHGVGHELHEDPNIPNVGRAGKGTPLYAGMTIAIEPMATLGTHQVFVADDGWTIKTRDGSLAAHFEHTILITQDGSEILTALDHN